MSNFELQLHEPSFQLGLRKLQFGVFLHKPRNLVLKRIGDGAGSAGQLGQLGLKDRRRVKSSRGEKLILRMISACVGCRPGVKKICIAVFQKLCFDASRPASHEGRFAVVTDVGCGMRWACRVAARVSRADEQSRGDGEIAWSWHPGADAKPAMTNCFGDGGKTAGPQGERV